jgi:hypothetical protein
VIQEGEYQDTIGRRLYYSSGNWFLDEGRKLRRLPPAIYEPIPGQRNLVVLNNSGRAVTFAEGLEKVSTDPKDKKVSR